MSRCKQFGLSLELPEVGGLGDWWRSYGHRRQWVEDRIGELAEIFAVAVWGDAVMSNHLHVQMVPQATQRPAEEVRYVSRCFTTHLRMNLVVS